MLKYLLSLALLLFACAPAFAEQVQSPPAAAAHASEPGPDMDQPLQVPSSPSSHAVLPLQYVAASDALQLLAQQAISANAPQLPQVTPQQVQALLSSQYALQRPQPPALPPLLQPQCTAGPAEATPPWTTAVASIISIVAWDVVRYKLGIASARPAPPA